MGMNMHAEGIRPGDEKWRQMKKAMDACLGAGVPVPQEVQQFFNNEVPDEAGVLIRLGADYGDLHTCCERYSEFGRSGFEIDIDSLPKGVKKIRFYCSW